MVGYLVFSLVNFGLMIFGGADRPVRPAGSAEIFGIPLGRLPRSSSSSVPRIRRRSIFDFIEQGVVNRVPKKYQWSGVFGIMVMPFWRDLEIL